jgi:hypothetical protein
METYAGKVIRVSKSAKGNWSLQMDDGNFYGLGSVTVPESAKGVIIDENDTVKFSYKLNGQWRNVEVDTIMVKKGPGPSPKEEKQVDTTGSTDYADTQKRIAMSGCLNTACNMITAGMANGTIKFTQKAGYAAMQAMLIEEAEVLYKYVMSTPANHAELMKEEKEAGEHLPEGLDLPEPEANDDNPW